MPEYHWFIDPRRLLLMTEITYGTEVITPDQAYDFLTQSGYIIGQRLSADVERLKILMLNNKWRLNGDAIVLDDEGNVIDGLKRLHACYISKKNLETVVVRNVSPDSKLTIGAHRPRRNSDFLKVKRVHNHSLVASIINALPSFARGAYAYKGTPAPSAALEIYDRYAERLGKAAAFARSGVSFREDKSVVGLFHFLFSAVDPVKAEAFLLSVFDRDASVEFPQSDGRRHLVRRWVENEQVDAKLKRAEKFALIVKAWNAVFSDDKMKILKWASGGGEAFPAIEGWSSKLDLNVTASSLNSADDGIEFEDENALEIMIEEIDPETAAQYLELNRDNNRNLVANSYNKYAQDMKAGLWQLNGQSIKFDKDGNLFDGQHRIKAGIESGVSFISLVVRNVPNEAFATYDDRPTKYFKDVLADRDIKYPSQLQGLITRIIKWSPAQDFYNSRDPSISEMDLYMKDHHDELVQLIGSEPAIIIREATRRGGVKVLGASGATFALWLLNKVDSEKAAQFIEKLFLGNTDPNEDQAIIALRNKCIADLSKPQKEQESTRKSEAKDISAMIKAWNAWITKTPVKKGDFLYNGDGDLGVPVSPGKA